MIYVYNIYHKCIQVYKHAYKRVCIYTEYDIVL